MAKVEYDNRFNGLIYVNAGDSVGGFIQGEEAGSNLSLRGKAAADGTDFDVLDGTEVVGNGRLTPFQSKNALAPAVTGYVTVRGKKVALSGWEREVNGNWAIQIKPSTRAPSRKPSDLFKRG